MRIANELATKFIENHLVPPLIHGDSKHQEWLKEELRKWIPELEDLLQRYAANR